VDGGFVGYGLGVDLGTTYTAAAVRSAGTVEIAQLGARRAEIPSLVYVHPDGAVLVGEAAERRGLLEPGRLAREFKRRVGDPVPVLVGGSPYSAHALMARLLSHVVDTVSGLQDGPPSTVTVTHPANWGPFKRELLEQAVRLADIPAVTLRSEPEAAALRFAATERLQPGEIIAVYDLGGGTFDAAVLRKTDDGFGLLGQPEGIEQLGGIDFDEAVFAHVLHTLGDVAERLDFDDDATTSALARLRRDCVEAKEALSYDTEVMIPVALPDLHTRVRLNRSEFEMMITPVLADTIGALRRALRSAELGPEDLRGILLAGGSSRIPLISQLVGAEFGVPTVLDPSPEHSIAIGAAIVSVPPEETPPAPAPSPDPVVEAPAPSAPPRRKGLAGLLRRQQVRESHPPQPPAPQPPAPEPPVIVPPPPFRPTEPAAPTWAAVPSPRPVADAAPPARPVPSRKRADPDDDLPPGVIGADPRDIEPTRYVRLGDEVPTSFGQVETAPGDEEPTWLVRAPVGDDPPDLSRNASPPVARAAPVRPPDGDVDALTQRLTPPAEAPTERFGFPVVDPTDRFTGGRAGPVGRAGVAPVDPGPASPSAPGAPAGPPPGSSPGPAAQLGPPSGSASAPVGPRTGSVVPSRDQRSGGAPVGRPDDARDIPPSERTTLLRGDAGTGRPAPLPGEEPPTTLITGIPQGEPRPADHDEPTTLIPLPATPEEPSTRLGPRPPEWTGIRPPGPPVPPYGGRPPAWTPPSGPRQPQTWSPPAPPTSGPPAQPGNLPTTGGPVPPEPPTAPINPAGPPSAWLPGTGTPPSAPPQGPSAPPTWAAEPPTVPMPQTGQAPTWMPGTGIPSQGPPAPPTWAAEPPTVPMPQTGQAPTWMPGTPPPNAPGGAQGPPPYGAQPPGQRNPQVPQGERPHAYGPPQGQQPQGPQPGVPAQPPQSFGAPSPQGQQPQGVQPFGAPPHGHDPRGRQPFGAPTQGQPTRGPHPPPAPHRQQPPIPQPPGPPQPAPRRPVGQPQAQQPARQPPAVAQPAPPTWLPAGAQETPDAPVWLSGAPTPSPGPRPAEGRPPTPPVQGRAPQGPPADEPPTQRLTPSPGETSAPTGAAGQQIAGRSRPFAAPPSGIPFPPAGARSSAAGRTASQPVPPPPPAQQHAAPPPPAPGERPLPTPHGASTPTPTGERPAPSPPGERPAPSPGGDERGSEPATRSVSAVPTQRGVRGTAPVVADRTGGPDSFPVHSGETRYGDPQRPVSSAPAGPVSPAPRPPATSGAPMPVWPAASLQQGQQPQPARFGAGLPPDPWAPPQRGRAKKLVVWSLLIVGVLLVIGAAAVIIYERSTGSKLFGSDTPTRPAAAASSPWTRGADLPVELEGAAVTAYRDRVWVAGGAANDAGHTTLKSVWVFDPVAGIWSRGPDLPRPVSQAALVPTPWALYLLGGRDGDTVSQQLLRLDETGGLWHLEAQLPAPRSAGAAGFDGSNIVFAGGVGSDGAVSAEVWALRGNGWTTLKSLSLARERLASVTDPTGRVLFLGGRDASARTAFGAIDRYASGAPAPVTSGASTVVDPPVHSAGGVRLDGVGVCVVGGERNGGAFNDWWCEREGAAASLPRLDPPRAGLGVARIGTTVYVVGGYGPGFTGTNRMESFTPSR
jgi:actin-like ATPase involved in cell morphogenesis